MSIIISTDELLSEARYPFRTPNPGNTVDTIIKSLADIEREIDSSEVNSEVTELSTGGAFFGRNNRPCLNIKLRESKTKELKKFGCAILPVCFGNLVYLVKYEYIDTGFFGSFKSKDERISNIKKKLNNMDKWMEYTFIQTLGDFVYVELLKKYDEDFNNNLDAFRTFFTVE